MSWKRWQIGARLRFDDLLGPQPKFGAVHEHQARPILPRIGRLHAAVHLDGVRRLIVVFDDPQGVVGHVSWSSCLTSASASMSLSMKTALPRKLHKCGHQEPRVGEFGRGQRIVDPIELQFVQLEIANLERDRRMLDQAVPQHVGRFRKSRVPTDENPQHGFVSRLLSNGSGASPQPARRSETSFCVPSARLHRWSNEN